MAAAHDLDCQDLEEFLYSMRQCFDEVEKELNDKSKSIYFRLFTYKSIPLDYLESRLEDHFQVVYAIAIAIQNTSDSCSDELKQLEEDLLSVSQSLLQEIHTTKIQREINERRSPAWVPSKEASTRGRPRHRIRRILSKIDPVGRALCRRSAIQRRQYNVKAPNQLWHMDGNHKLVNWRFVIHGCTDGYIRAIVCQKCATNNLACTVLEFFIKGTHDFGIPLRERGDHDVENVEVARFMVENRGDSQSSFIAGRSVHSVRMEELWREMNRVVIAFYKDIFHFLEDPFLLDSKYELDLFAIHYIYQPRINASLEQFVEQWNFHGIRTAGYHSPMALWHSGTLQSMDDAVIDCKPESYGIDFESSISEMNGAVDIVVPENQVQLTEQEMAVLRTHVPDPLEDDGNSGFDLFISVCDVVKSVNNMP
ncbi:hypothetical protein AWC38_SpisGene20104 [Stylophora pistillata]|uniref:Integrase core domain-containing protein n=1 Tax=Stylophora pistillata TaxID=50429 RepID=A0A2B4RHE1_STYPI|nr:hypothetical protein AWC38_SpisGene20104 [Stylophora pistillata]